MDKEDDVPQVGLREIMGAVLGVEMGNQKETIHKWPQILKNNKWWYI